MAGARATGLRSGAVDVELDKLVVRCLEANVGSCSELRMGPDTERFGVILDNRLAERLGVSLEPDTARRGGC